MHKLADLVPGSGQDVPVIGIAHTLAGNTEGEYGFKLKTRPHF